jgi:hypothetical protein
MLGEIKGLASNKTVALQQFILSVSLPILIDGEKQPEPWGTGTLFKIEDRHFLVTAAHVVSDVDLTKLTFPSGLRNATLQKFGAFEVFRPKSPLTVDVAVVEFKAKETVGLLSDGWSFLGLDSVAAAGCYHGRFIVGGYPVAIHRFDGEQVQQSMLALTTDLLHYTPDVSDPQPEFDQFFYHAPEGKLLDGTTQKMPRLNGASGASIWVHLGVSSSSLWSPSAATKIVGVQVSASHGRWFRGAERCGPRRDRQDGDGPPSRASRQRTRIGRVCAAPGSRARPGHQLFVPMAIEI